MNQHTAGRGVAGVDLDDRDSWVCVIDAATDEMRERATTPTNAEALRASFARRETIVVALERDRINARVLRSWLAVLLTLVIENETKNTWGNLTQDVWAWMAGHNRLRTASSPRQAPAPRT